MRETAFLPKQGVTQSVPGEQTDRRSARKAPGAWARVNRWTRQKGRAMGKNADGGENDRVYREDTVYRNGQCQGWHGLCWCVKVTPVCKNYNELKIKDLCWFAM